MIVPRRAALLALLVFVSPARAELPSRVQSLIDAELRLATDMSGRDPRQALVDRLTGMAILLRPRPVAAMQWLPEHPPAAGKWKWHPEHVEISGAGDLGYTTGPWSFVDAADRSAHAGSYVAIWRWHPKTGWKLLLQAATETAAALPDSTAEKDPSFRIGSSTRLAPHDSLVVERAGLVQSDSLLARLIGMAGERGAHDSLGTRDTRVLRSASVSDHPTVSIEPVGSRLAESGDLGYTFGICRFAAPRPDAKIGSSPGTVRAGASIFSYVHIWRRDAAGRRRLALDLEIPVPHE